MTLDDIYKKLELLDKDCLIRRLDNWQDKVQFPSRTMRLLEKNASLCEFDAFFCFDNKPLILFFENPKDIKSLHRAIWNFNETPIVIVVEGTQVSVFNGFCLLKDKKVLERLGGDEQLSDFTYFNLVTGRSWMVYEEKIKQNNRVDRLLLSNIELVLRRLHDNYGLETVEANAIVGKIIFIRYLIDRKVKLHFRNKSKYWTNCDLCNLLEDKSEFCDFISYLQDKDIGFSGDVFPIDAKRILSIDDGAFRLLISMLKSDVENGQQFLFDVFDFSVLPIEFISNVYEKFIGRERQAKRGAYYTPTFLVDYIVKETVSDFLDHHEGWNCRVLDPACGSGIFLVESLRKMIGRYISEKGIQKTDGQFKKALVEIATRNIFGIDKDLSAVHVAIFSIYLTLLDYQSPADIEYFKFPNIFGKNLIHANAFNLEDNAIRDLESQSRILPFDCIIGNPPWMRGGGEEYLTVENYLRIKQKTDEKCIVTNKEISQAFIIRSFDFAAQDTKCALIVTSKNLYNRKARPFRSYFTNIALIEQVFELGPVRREIFVESNDRAIAPACILFFRHAYGMPTKNQMVTHVALKPSRFFSLFKVFALSSRDIQQITQGLLIEYDWLWKVLVYGSYLDFLFIKRLHTLKTVQNLIDNSQKLLTTGQGLKRSDGKKHIGVQNLIGMPYLKTVDVKRYLAAPEAKWNEDYVGYVPQDNSWYKGPFLVVREGTPSDLRAVAAINKTDAIYKSSLTCIRTSGKKGVRLLKNIEGIFNSSFFAYYNLLTFSSSGIEREQTHDEEKLSVPYCSQKLTPAVTRIEKLIAQKHKLTLPNLQIEEEIKSQYEKIDAIITQAFQCTERELSLIDYAQKVSIPLAMRTADYDNIMQSVPQGDSMLRDYVKVILRRFAPTFERIGKQLVAEGWYSNHILGFHFKVVTMVSPCDFYWTPKAQSQAAFLEFLAKISSSSITNRLFINKDVRGFEKNSFYIFKPNERRLWHKSIAFLDAEDFADAILREGGRS